MAAACFIGREGPKEIPETWESPAFETANLDSLAYWPGKQWLFATAKGSHAILIFNASSGELVDRFGGQGAGPGQLQRPNGIAVCGDLLWVVERDNRRVQVFSLPRLDFFGSFGEGLLRRPYGIALFAPESSLYQVYITDNYMDEDGSIPAENLLGERVKCFQVRSGEDGLESSLVNSFGAVEGDGVLHKVESIAVDAEMDRVLVADEEERFCHIKVYTLAGDFTGTIMGDGVFQIEPEGIDLYSGPGGRVWVTTDQYDERTVFHLFTRAELTHIGSFQGGKTGNTDGICTTGSEIEGFPRGAVFAVHDDTSVSAFSWEAITREVLQNPFSSMD